MRQFFKFMFASMLGTFLSLVLAFFLFLAIISGIIAASSENREVAISPNSVLLLKLDYPIQERTSSRALRDIMLTGFSLNAEPGLNDILANIKKAAQDEKIEGIYLDLSSLPSGIATVEEIRNALLDFRKSGKFIIAYGEVLSQTSYYLATAATGLYLYPGGGIDFKGINAEVMFYKGAFGKLGIEPVVIRHGKFKSAVEPYMTDRMSPENREQVKVFVTSIWNGMLKNIAESRKTTESELQQIADTLGAQLAADAFRYKLVDKLLYKDEVLALLREKLGIGEKEKISFVNLKAYTHSVLETKEKKQFTKDKIAVVYASGTIVEGKGDEELAGAERISEAIRKARLDSHVKAIVLRVNSPGGSALGSDIIWREVVLARQTKPVVASFGDYAASGGYFIACGANRIIAQPNTLTGSIGAFGMQFNAQNLVNEKLGITIDTVKTGKMADHGSVFRGMTAAEQIIVQRSIDRIYDDFISKVAEGRKISKSFVDSIGQGRVWTASDAMNIKLVDEIGGLNKAVEAAASLARIADYRISELPEQKPAFRKLMEGFTEEVKLSILEGETGEAYQYYSHLRDLMKSQGIQARMPYEIQFR
jgi:protease IV